MVQGLRGAEVRSIGTSLDIAGRGDLRYAAGRRVVSLKAAVAITLLWAAVVLCFLKWGADAAGVCGLAAVCGTAIVAIVDVARSPLRIRQSKWHER